ncbi:MAG: 16S rRNA (cytidine(1402)-2'-O)-methyltransferase [Candidatus Omnitrophica bacterium]|nr:16S rRNA (cytidine(1402)-2'-O)-methyltransferase [Candidatus Omnitrophota bacterium]MDD5441175.1 16S rRNA (cytidine(1402)-2'-O)-methyltransferase [Candidatus Omnitrophota bacterium]
MLYIVSTPIGNLEDITLRAIRILKEVDIILAEDTRVTGVLLKKHNIVKKTISFHDHNENKKIKQTISLLKEGKNIALVSDAGTPAISDPGYLLIKKCREENLQITVLPGACAAIAAITLTSFSRTNFKFMGYMPRKKTQCEKIIKKIQDEKITTVFYESPYRVLKSLEIIANIMPENNIAIIREITKKFEEVIEGKAKEIFNKVKEKTLKGEIVLIISE